MRLHTNLSRRPSLKFLLVLMVLVVSSFPSLAQAGKAIVIKGGKVLTVSHGTIENGVVVIENGKIAAVGDASTKVPSGAQVIDAKGMTVYPGIIDSETHLGLTEVSADQMTNDLIETSDEIMPHMHVYDAFHAESALIPVTRVNGITNAIVAPDNGDTLPGQDILIQLDGDSSNQMILVKDIAMPMNFTGDQRRNESFEHAKYPQTRMGMAAQLRQAFLDAQDYMQKQADYEKKAKTDKTAAPPKRDLKLEALLPYLKGERPVILAANSPADVDTAVSLANEFHLKFVLNHVQHAQKALDYIATLKVPVIVGPIWELPKQDERYDSVYKLPAELQKRGVKVILASDDAHNVRNLPYQAGYAVAYGLPYDEALKAITLYPAQAFGIDKDYGSLDVGKVANVVIANGDPLDVKTDVKHVFIAGKEISMENRQTRLRDQYSK